MGREGLSLKWPYRLLSSIALGSTRLSGSLCRIGGRPWVGADESHHTLTDIGVVGRVLDDAMSASEFSCFFLSLRLVLDPVGLSAQALHERSSFERRSDVRLIEKVMNGVVVPRVITSRIWIGGGWTDKGLLFDFLICRSSC